MNQFIKAAVENMERVETDDRNREYRKEWTQAAIAYALIAIAEAMDKRQATAMDLLSPNRTNS